MPTTDQLTPAAASILDLVRCRGGKIVSNDESLQAWSRKTRYLALKQLVRVGLVVVKPSLHDARTRVYEVVA